MTDTETAPEVEKKEETNNETAVEKVERILHPLKRKWTYWYLNDHKNVSWEDRLKQVCTFDTVEEFWALYNNIRPPSGLNSACDYNVFKNGIQPMWEEPENKNGGRWLISFERNRPGEHMDLVWLELLMALIGEQFEEDMENICGLVCNVRVKGSKISLWTRDHKNEESNFRIGDSLNGLPRKGRLVCDAKGRLFMAITRSQVMKKKLMTAEMPAGVNWPGPLFDVIRYEDHDSCQKKSGSTVKALLSISSHDEMTRTPNAAVPVAQ